MRSYKESLPEARNVFDLYLSFLNNLIYPYI
jgi:hypothetical protein